VHISGLNCEKLKVTLNEPRSTRKMFRVKRSSDDFGATESIRPIGRSVTSEGSFSCANRERQSFQIYSPSIIDVTINKK
jgi:hypothetical protein